jgi:hypothetical protein
LEDKIGLIISRICYFMENNFNIPLYGKLFVVFEELKSTSFLEWMNLSNVLKIYITNFTIKINEKHVLIFKCENISLLIVVTNKNAIQLENNNRKWFVLDISNEKCQNIQYFDKLLKVMNNKM